ncbi:hypothetical protein BJ165DRAFT_1614740 [Panaeolus papilionaceus]|nr:hypothetical protein BJ165DRAFT_1614740 [Panaeolus papilionaceus]
MPHAPPSRLFVLQSPIAVFHLRRLHFPPPVSCVAKWDVIRQESVVVVWYDGEGVRMYRCGNLSGVEEVLDVCISNGEVLGNVKESRSKELDRERQDEKEREVEREV